ncbi:MAG: family 16 glycosylhydrolase [Planctomycetota bacterium]
MKFLALSCVLGLLLCSVQPVLAEEGNTIDLSEWKLVWEDDFDYPDAQLDEKWVSQNGPNGHILSSRWRENAVVKDGILHLVNRKESRGGQEWTSGNIWSKKKFKYGYFECRYRYAEASGTNNSFWLMTLWDQPDPEEGKRFEIDINEGHYPNEVNTNIHNWTDITTLPNGKKTHPSDSKSFTYGTQAGYSLPLEIPVTTRKVRLTFDSLRSHHIHEFRVYGENDRTFPDAMSDSADQDLPGLVNHARDAGVKITSNGDKNDQNIPANVTDGKIGTSWINQAGEGEKTLTFEWPEDITIGCIQFVNGWKYKGAWVGMVPNYRIEYHDGDGWNEVSSLDVSEVANFGKNYHVFGLEWDEEKIVFYKDGKEIRREKNEFAYSEAPIWLSLAIIKWDGPVTDAIDGTSMKVDWVRYYQRKE